MDKQDIIRMAREAGLVVDANQSGFDDLERFFHMAQAAAVEQERKEFAVHAIDIARKAIEERDKFWQNHIEPQIEIEVNEAILEEREACAKVCDRWWNEVARDCADAIRARGELK
jgi:uncharacterized Ntn-hydrolase superfamily protein